MHPSTEPADDPGRRPAASPDPPSPLSDRQRTFVDDNVTWLYTITALVESPIPGGRCVSVVGTITPTLLETGVLAHLRRNPEIQIIIDGASLRPDDFRCDPSALVAAGYESLESLITPQGTPVAFYRQFFIGPEASEADTYTLNAGSPYPESLTPMVVDVMATIPPPDLSPLREQPALPVQPLPLALRPWTDQGTSWDLRAIAVTEVPARPGYGGTKSCYAIHGLAVPSLGDGLVARGRLPVLTLMGGGRVSNVGILECDSSVLEAVGFGPPTESRVTDGTPYRFYTLALLDKGQPIEALIIGAPASPDAEFFHIDVEDEIVVPDISDHSSPPLVTLPHGEPATLGDAPVTILGVAPVVNNDPERARGTCWVVFGMVNPPAGARLRGLGIGAIVEGQFSEGHLNGSCDRSAAEDAGYTMLSSDLVADGSSLAFWTNLLLPADATIEAIVVGGTTSDAVAFSGKTTGVIPAPAS